jgi:kynurenine formamidase
MPVSRAGNWNRWGPDDEEGALNLIDSEVVLLAARLVQRGRVVVLSQELGPGTPTPPHRRPPARFMDRDGGDYLAGAKAPGGFCFAEDTIQFATHSGTHLDALSHVWREGSLYNGHPSSSIRSNRGAQRCGVEKLRPIVTRGVMLDLEETVGVLASGQEIMPSDLEAACSKAAIEINPGDAVLIRTGWWEHNRGDPTRYWSGEPGIGLAAAEWLGAHDVSLVGSDNFAVEAIPFPTSEVFAAHLTLIREFGVPLLEGLDLQQLREERCSTFLFVAAPLRLVGSTGSPVAPLAVL